MLTDIFLTAEHAFLKYHEILWNAMKYDIVKMSFRVKIAESAFKTMLRDVAKESVLLTSTTEDFSRSDKRQLLGSL